MVTRSKVKRPASGRALREWSASAPTGSPLNIDRDAKVIEGVRVLGRFSRNRHGLREAANGTEYTIPCMRDALPMYEGAEVLANHDMLEGRTAGLQKRQTHRGVEYVIGVLRESRMDESKPGNECIRADLHYFDTHPMTPRVLEDVERGLGVFGLSHDASAKTERFDRAARRLVIESLAAVRSVDLVRKPATNRNLWEDLEQPVSTTLREQLEERLPKWKGNRRKWAHRLLEDDAMAPMMDAPVDAPPEEPEDALWAGFQAAIATILDKYKSGDLDEKAAGKQVMDYLKTHKKLTGSDEPEEPTDDTPPDPPASDDKKTEAEKELAATKHKLAVRELCEEIGVKTDKTLLESLEAMPLDKARKLVEREKARPSGGPKAGGAPSGGKPGKKPTGKDFLAAITE